MVIYAAVRALGLLVLGLWAARLGHSLLFELGARFDTTYFLTIAQHGYGRTPSSDRDLAFFPLYPMAIRAVDLVSPFSAGANAVAIAWASGLAAAWGIFALARRVAGTRVALILVALWAALPHAVVESMGYTEALFTALSVWCLYALLTRRWVLTGVLSLFAGLERPTGLILALIVVAAAVVELVRTRARSWRPWLALVLAPIGSAAYLLWVASVTGQLNGWSHIQTADWGSGFDYGRFTVLEAVKVLTASSSLDFYTVTLLLFLSAALLVIGAIQRQPWPIWAFSALVFVSTFGESGYYNSKGRFLIPAIGLLLPVAQALARARTSIAIVAVTTFALISAYFGGYLLLVWPWSP